MAYKSGFVAIIGRPNVGKSTLMNAFVGQKIAIMSDKAQTTRNKIQAIYTTDDEQIIFIDTPGIHKPKNGLDEYMDSSAYQALEDIDIVVMMINASEYVGTGDRFVMDKIHDLEVPKLLVVNKIDELSHEALSEYLSKLPDLSGFDGVYLISAKTGDGLDRLLEAIVHRLPEGPQFYPEDAITDHPEYFIVEELIREQILQTTREEVPHAIAVMVNSMKRDKNGRVNVYADIIVERESQKGIIIGKGGKKLKTIGTNARHEMKKLLGDKIYLELFVKVEKNWRNNEAKLREFGYDRKSNR